MPQHESELLTELNDQHVEIHKKLYDLLAGWSLLQKHKTLSSEYINSWNHFFEFLINDHFAKEEVLFQKLIGAPYLNHGGPRCTYFMGLFLNDQMLERRFQILSKAITDYDLKKTLLQFPSWLTESSPLKIPLEEHLWIQNYQSAIIIFLKRIQAAPENEELWFQANDAIQSFAKFLSFHREKEDTCLFQLIKCAFLMPRANCGARC